MIFNNRDLTLQSQKDNYLFIYSLILNANS